MIKKIILSMMFLISGQYCFSMSGWHPSITVILDLLEKEFANQEELDNFEEFIKIKSSQYKKQYPKFNVFFNTDEILKLKNKP